MAKLEHFPINWVNGLKLTNKHFFENYYNNVEYVHNNVIRQINDYNYGIAEQYEIGKNSIQFDISGDSIYSLNVKLQYCDAVTRGGIPIVYYSGLYGDEVPSAEFKAESDNLVNVDYYIMISSNPYNLVPVGKPDPDEIPLHHPYMLPKINLHFVPKDQVNNTFYKDNFLVIAEIRINGTTFTINKQFIPPLQRVKSFMDVAIFVEELSKTLHIIKNDIRTIYAKNIADKRRDVLVNNTFIICSAFNDFFADNIFFLEQIALEQPPIYIANCYSILANKILSAILSISEREKEALLQYYHEWINITPADFITAIETVANNNYNHLDINASLEKIEKMFSVISKMFHKMSELEYIGLPHENIVIKVENSNNPETQDNKRKWKFF